MPTQQAVSYRMVGYLLILVVSRESTFVDYLGTLKERHYFTSLLFFACEVLFKGCSSCEGDEGFCLSHT